MLLSGIHLSCACPAILPELSNCIYQNNIIESATLDLGLQESGKVYLPSFIFIDTKKSNFMSISAVTYSFSKWLLEKVGTKLIGQVFDPNKGHQIDKKFQDAILKTSKSLQEKYPEALGGAI